MSENITNNEDGNLNRSSASPDIDELEAIIKQKMAEDENNLSENGYEFGPDYAYSFENNSEEEIDLENEYYDMSPQEKKYVIAVGPDNVPFFDGLSPEKRTELVNSWITHYQEELKKTPDEIRTKKFIKHAFVVLLTVVIGFPLIFYITNASIEATVNSYREIQGNFEKLYKEKGGIKRKDLTKIQNLQY